MRMRERESDEHNLSVKVKKESLTTSFGLGLFPSQGLGSSLFLCFTEEELFTIFDLV